MRVLYNIAHNGFLIKAIAHRYHYHRDDYAVFQIDKILYDVLDVNVLENTKFVYMDIFKYAMDEGENLENNIVTYVEHILETNQLEPSDFDEIYHLVDEVDLFGIYLENKKVPYITIEAVENIFQVYDNFRPRSRARLRLQSSNTRSYEYDLLIVRKGIRSGRGARCKHTIFMKETTSFPSYIKDCSLVKRWDYKGIIATFPTLFLGQMLKLFKTSFDINSGREISVIVLSSRLVCSAGLRKRGLVDNVDLNNEFILLHQLMADFFVSTENEVYFKPHPREIEFKFTPYIQGANLMPAAFPMELLPLYSNIKVKELLSSASSSGSYFKGDAESSLLGKEYLELYPALIKLLVAIKVLEAMGDYNAIYFSGINVSLSRIFLRKYLSRDIRILPFIKDVNPNEKTLLLCNNLNQWGRRKLLPAIKRNANMAGIFLSTDHVPEIFTSKDMKKNIQSVKISKEPFAKGCLMKNEDEYIHVFSRDTSCLNNVKNFEFTHCLNYVKANIKACSIKDFNLGTAFNTEGVQGENMSTDKAVKFREVGTLLSTTLDYSATIENGVVKVQLIGVPEGTYVGYDLLRNLKVMDSLFPAFSGKASFTIKSFGDYGVRFRFYDKGDLSKIIYRFDTAPLIYEPENLVQTLNVESQDISEGLDNLERILFAEKQRKSDILSTLATLQVSKDLGHSFVDELLRKGVSSLYFYCDEEDWMYGHAIYNSLFVDERIEIIDCVSEFTYVSSNLIKTRFTAYGSIEYTADDYILIVSSEPTIEIMYGFTKYGAKIVEIQDVAKDALQYAREVYPYLEFKRRFPDVDFAFIKEPASLIKSTAEKRSENENEIVNKKPTLLTIRRGLTEKPPVIPLALAECGETIEQVAEYIAYAVSDLQRNNDGWSMPKDRVGQFVNVKNGCRVTTDIPEHARNSIYLFGGDMVYAPCVSDGETMTSCLQRFLNSYHSFYKVVNCGGYSENFVSNMHRIMLNGFEYKKGDIVLVMLDVVPEALEKSYKILDLEQIFNRPHGLGEIWIDSSILLNKKGQEIIAKEIFINLQNQGLLHPCPNARGYE